MTATLDAPRTAAPSPPTTVTLTIARQALRTALARLAGAVGSGVKALPVAQHVKCEVAPGLLTLTATDFEVFVRLTVPCDATGPAVALLPARRLAEIVANLPPVGAVSLALTGTRVVLTAGRARFELAGMDPVEFPLTPEVHGVDRATVDAAAFLDALERVVPHASDAPSRPSLNAVRLGPGPRSDAMTVVTCDAQTLAHVTVPIDGIMSASCLVFRLAVPMLARLFAGLPDDARLSLRVDTAGARLAIEGPDASATVRLVDLVYPEYAFLIDRHTPTRVVTSDRLLLRAAIQRVALMTGVARRIEIDLADEITIRAVDPDGGAGADVVPVESHDGGASPEPRTFALNASAVLAALDTLAAPTVALSFESPTKSVLFRPDPATPDQPLVLTQPLRVL